VAEPVLTDIDHHVGQSDARKSLRNGDWFNRPNDVVIMKGPLAVQCINVDEDLAVDLIAYADAIGAAIPTIGLLSGTPPIEPANGASNEKMPPSEATIQ